MVKRLPSLLVAALVTFAFAGSVLAETMQGTLSKVDRREVTVKSKDGKEVTLSVSGSRTKVEGVGDRSELKVGQKVTVEHDGGEAKMIKVSK
jgi:outer membrane lipoprotein SlyB